MTTPTAETNASKQILIIEDDPLIADVYRDKLLCEGFAVDVAGDGRCGLERFENSRPDLVLLDLMLPHVTGVEVLRAIRQKWSPRELPVLVFTNAYLGGAVQQAWEAGANQVLTKATVPSKVLVGIIKNALETPPPAAIGKTIAQPEVPTPAFDPAMRQRFLEEGPATLAALWQPLKTIAATPRELEPLEHLYDKIQIVTTEARLAGLAPIAHISAALGGLVKDLSKRPGRMTPSVLLTMAQAIDTLKFLFAHPHCARANHTAAQILVVDDDEFTLRSVSRALQRVNLSVTCVDTPVGALKRRVGIHFDLIFLDIELPDATGFDLCSRMRAMPAYKNTPVIFLSVHKSLEKRAESVLRGGNDYITKPFLPMEIAVKALSFIIRGPLPPAETSKGSNGKDVGSVFSRRELNTLKQAILSSLDRP